MRPVLVCLLSGVLLLGCKHGRPSDSAPRGDQAAAQKPRATPLQESSGTIASVNPTLRFVVIDFYLKPLPQVDQRMSVYREGQKIGEVKISSQSRNSIIAADLVAGEARTGDEVRPE
jgi:hypothetical protein